jgi:hypothetical protein
VIGCQVRPIQAERSHVKQVWWPFRQKPIRLLMCQAIKSLAIVLHGVPRSLPASTTFSPVTVAWDRAAPRRRPDAASRSSAGLSSQRCIKALL